jgi:hypothetical protein
MARYTINLATVQALRHTLVAADDLPGLHRLTERALTFAYLSIHNRVETHEKWYAMVCDGTWTPRGLPAHKMVTDVPRIVRETFTDVTMYAGDDSYALCERITSLRWIAAAKAHFTAALLGYPDAPCIDVHMSRHIRVKSVPSDVKRYRAMIAQSCIKTTADQWEAYALRVPFYAETQHDCYFASVLGTDAVTKVRPVQYSFAFV